MHFYIIMNTCPADLEENCKFYCYNIAGICITKLEVGKKSFELQFLLKMVSFDLFS